MDLSNIAYKIKKYTLKLRNASTLQEAELYQNKLKYYHNLNKNGGTYLSEGSIIDIKDDITSKLKDATRKIQTIKEFSVNEIDELSEKISVLSNDIERITKKQKSVDKLEINDAIPEMSEFNIENYLS